MDHKEEIDALLKSAESTIKTPEDLKALNYAKKLFRQIDKEEEFLNKKPNRKDQ
ncbi:hypothetical protein KFZ76_12910 [Methylovulum psychrotolerans]|uniref:hypothetical protein n=1 Tax=Methylovulum psychrotolerans TaxID=1704499 RepID=UPI001BFFA767|nr:hypothetical protein [Methylovulum psychrotolerans]MBT9098601.1 hypothetical protein [Methylovulum psychrotolerans]